MKKIFLSFFCLSALVLLFSCNENKKTATEEFREGLTASDTTAMLDGCELCMSMLKDGKIDVVLDSLYEYDDSTNTVERLSETTRAKYKRIFTMFPVKEYRRDYYSFHLEGLNDVKYTIRFSEEDEEVAETAFMFNPVRVDGRWYVTVKTAEQDINELRR